MGVPLFGSSSSSSYDHSPNCGPCPNQEPAAKLPNPNPNNYILVKSSQLNGFLIVKINYPDCENYEGNKILVYRGVHLDQLLKQKSIDPHFSKNKKYYSPIARFEPTEKGWEMAELLCSLST